MRFTTDSPRQCEFVFSIYTMTLFNFVKIDYIFCIFFADTNNYICTLFSPLWVCQSVVIDIHILGIKFQSAVNQYLTAIGTEHSSTLAIRLFKSFKYTSILHITLISKGLNKFYSIHSRVC